MAEGCMRCRMNEAAERCAQCRTVGRAWPAPEVHIGGSGARCTSGCVVGLKEAYRVDDFRCMARKRIVVLAGVWVRRAARGSTTTRAAFVRDKAARAYCVYSGKL
jgi:hypothetical protein